MRIASKKLHLIFLLLTGYPGLAQIQRIVIPLGGNSWVLEGRDERIKETEIIGWNDPDATIQTYVYVAKPGNVKLYLTANVTGKSSVSVTIQRKSTEIVLDKTGLADYYMGEWVVSKSGYVKIEMKGLSKTGETFGTPSHWIMEGTAIDEKASFVKDNKDNYFYWGRRGPSVHLNYPVPADEKVEWFYNEVTVPENQDVIGSYFMANGFGEGYFGMQVNSDTERRILFSVWSPYKTDDPKSIPPDKQINMLKKGENVYTGEFGNEGSGGQSYLKYNWKAGSTYRFLLQGKPSGDSSTTYTAYFYPPEIGKWTLIASFKRPKTETYLKHLHSFLENFIPETGDTGRRVYFGNQWVYNTSGKWRELNNAKFSADATARKGYRMDYAGGAEKNQFYLQNCGFFDGPTAVGSEFEREKKDNFPQIDLESLP